MKVQNVITGEVHHASVVDMNGVKMWCINELGWTADTFWLTDDEFWQKFIQLPEMKEQEGR